MARRRAHEWFSLSLLYPYNRLQYDAASGRSSPPPGVRVRTGGAFDSPPLGPFGVITQRLLERGWRQQDIASARYDWR